LDYYVIMPNHIHGIIIINELEGRDVARYVSKTETKFSKISPKPGSLSAIVRSFKSAVTKRMHVIGEKNFKRQSDLFKV
jgi:ERCC4-related helicase